MRGDLPSHKEEFDLNELYLKESTLRVGPEMQTVPDSRPKSCTRGSLRRSSFRAQKVKAIHFRRDIEFAPGSPPLSPIRRKASFARTLSTSSSSSGSFARTLSASSSSSGFTSPSFFSPEPTSTNELLTVFQSAPLVEDAVDDADHEPFNGPLLHHMSSSEGEAVQNFHAVSDRVRGYMALIAYQQRSL